MFDIFFLEIYKLNKMMKILVLLIVLLSLIVLMVRVLDENVSVMVFNCDFFLVLKMVVDLECVRESREYSVFICNIIV